VNINDRKEKGPDGNQGPTLKFDKTKVHDTTLSDQGTPLEEPVSLSQGTPQGDSSDTVKTPPLGHFSKTINKFRFVSAWSLVNNPVKENWLIESYIEADTLILIYGPPGCMKTFLALDIGLSIASGEDWHGLSIKRQGPVYYIAGEGANGLSRRLDAWQIAHGVDLIDIPFWISNQPAQLLNEENAIAIAAEVDRLSTQFGSPALVIIDTLARNFGSGDENSTKDMSCFINMIDHYIRVRYGCATMIVHHAGHNSDRARGSSALRGALDWEFHLTKTKDTVLLSPTKVKDHETPPNISFKAESITIEGKKDEEDMTSCVMRKVETTTTSKPTPLKGANMIAFETLNKKIQENEVGVVNGSISESTWRQVAFDKGISSSNIADSKRTAFRRAFKYLQSKHYVEEKNGYWSPIQDKETGQDRSGTCPG
jgi:5S rRNA maturation endonuclease (ribonuclease M5)